MGLGLGYILAGGAEAVGDEWQKARNQQRTFELTQIDQNADLLRQKNFARFSFDLNTKLAERRQALETKGYGQRRAIDLQYRPTNYEDPNTGLPMTYQDLKARGSAEGLTDVRDANAQRSAQDLITKQEAVLDAAEQRVIDRYGEGSQEHEDWKAANIVGYSRPKKNGENVDESKAMKEFSRLVNQRAGEYSTNDRTVAEYLAALEVVGKLPEGQMEVVLNSDFYKSAASFKRLGDKVMAARKAGKTRKEVVSELQKKLSDQEISQLFEFLEESGQLQRQTGVMKVIPGEYKGAW